MAIKDDSSEEDYKSANSGKNRSPPTKKNNFIKEEDSIEQVDSEAEE